MSTYIVSFKFDAGNDETATKLAEASAMLMNKVRAESFTDTVSEIGIAFTKLEEEGESKPV